MEQQSQIDASEVQLFELRSALSVHQSAEPAKAQRPVLRLAWQAKWRGLQLASRVNQLGLLSILQVFSSPILLVAWAK